MLTATTIYTKDLKVGDKICHFTGDIWEVISRPKITRQGMNFKVKLIDSRQQNVTFDPDWRFEFLS